MVYRKAIAVGAALSKAGRAPVPVRGLLNCLPPRLPPILFGMGGVGFNQVDNTRQNVGRQFVSYMSQRFRVEMATDAELNCSLGELRQRTFPPHTRLVLPQVPLHANATAALNTARHLQLTHRDILFVHDDSRLPFGVFKFTVNGSTSSHYGMESVAKKFGGKGFWRLHLGVKVGRAVSKDSRSDPFTSEELQQLPTFFENIIEALKQTAAASATSTTSTASIVSSPEQPSSMATRRPQSGA